MTFPSNGAESPSKLKVVLSSVWEGDKALVWGRDRLSFSNRGNDPLTRAPSAEDWTQFRYTLDKLTIWNWQPDYNNHGVLDGLQWEIEIIYLDRGIICFGSNAYPDESGASNNHPAMSKPFVDFIDAVNKLFGARVF